jgi:preprotein translocase subunit YajC
MHDNTWNFGMGWGMWIVPLLVIIVILYFVRFRRRK